MAPPDLNVPLSHMSSRAGRAISSLGVSQTASDLDETRVLSKAKKRLEAICCVVEAINNNGLDSDKFVEVYDLQITQLNLEPAEKVSWPAHILWSRHKQDINTVNDPDRWFSRVSSDQLQKHGVADVSREQDMRRSESGVS